VILITSWRKREARLSNDGSIPLTNDATSLGVNRSGRRDVPVKNSSKYIFSIFVILFTTSWNWFGIT
jgi:hypothetical protein